MCESQVVWLSAQDSNKKQETEARGTPAGRPMNSTEAPFRERHTHADFEGLEGVVQQQYAAHDLCVLPVSLQLRRPDIVGSASRQVEARAHHAPTRA